MFELTTFARTLNNWIESLEALSPHKGNASNRYNSQIAGNEQMMPSNSFNNKIAWQRMCSCLKHSEPNTHAPTAQRRKYASIRAIYTMNSDNSVSNELFDVTHKRKKKTKNTRHVWIKNKFQLSFRKYTTKELLVNKLLRTSFIRTKGQWNIVSHLSGRCLHRRPYSNKYTAAIDVYCSNGQLVRVRLLDTMKMFILYSRLTLCDFPLPWPDHWVTPTSATINQSTLASIQSCHCHVVPRCAVSRCMPWSTISVSLH